MGSYWLGEREPLGKVYVAKMVRKRLVLPDFSYCFFFVIVMAALSIANIVKTSLGPVGLDKMLVDDVGVRTKALP